MFHNKKCDIFILFQERWLDWALSQILDKSTNISAINLPLRKQLFAILSSVFIKEIQNISENNPSDDCSGYLLAYLTKGRGYALVLCMAKIPEKGTCPLELTILLLYLVSRLVQFLKKAYRFLFSAIMPFR